MSDEKKEDVKEEATKNVKAKKEKVEKEKIIDVEAKKNNMKKEVAKEVEVVKKDNVIKEATKEAETKKEKKVKAEPAEAVDTNNAKKKKKIILFSSIAGVAVLLLILIIVLVVNLTGKPNKKTSEALVKDFLEAVNDKDGDEFVKLVDTKGYVIFNEEKESKFNDKYKKKDEYFKRYQKKNNFDDAEDVDDSIASSFKSSVSSKLGSQYSYTDCECSLKEIAEISKSKKSSKLIVIKAKVKVKSTYSTDVKTLRLYTVKSSGEYKIVGYEFV
ncbi:MAG: hypothetical protein J6J36_05020 [Clostridia bacterium]|nr:hypothetical protein [Clostridia bacterium]